MNEELLTVSLHTAYQVLQDEFPTGVAPDSAEELAQFRSKFYESAARNGLSLPDFTDEQLVSILLAVGFCFLGRFFSPRLSWAVKRLKYHERAELEGSPIPYSAAPSASKVCLKLLFLRSFFSESSIFSLYGFYSSLQQTLKAFDVRDFEDAIPFVKETFPFRRQIGEGVFTYFAVDDRSVKELTTETLYKRALDISRKNGSVAPISFDALTQGVYISMWDALGALNAEDAPFERTPDDCYLPLGVDEPALALDPDAPQASRFLDPQPDLASDDAFETILAAFLDSLKSPQDDPDARKSPFFYLDRATGEDIPHDRSFSEELARLPLCVRPSAADDVEAAKSVPENANVAPAPPLEPETNAVEDAPKPPEPSVEAAKDDAPANGSGDGQTSSPLAPEKEALGELLDRLFRDGHTIVFYSPLFKRYPEVFERAGVESYLVKTALKEARPQYRYETLYATPAKSPLAELEIIRNQLLLKWGVPEKSATLNELAARVFIPVASIKNAIGAFPDVFLAASDGKITVSAETVNEANQIFDGIVDEERGSWLRIAFYSTFFLKNSAVLALLGIASADELRKAILERGLNIRDFGEYMTLGAVRDESKDALILTALRAAGLLLAIGWQNERLERLQSRKTPRSFQQKFQQFVNLQKDRYPPSLKIERLHKLSIFFIPEDETIRVLKAHPECFRPEPKGEWSILSRDGVPSLFWSEDDVVREMEALWEEIKLPRGEEEGEGVEETEGRDEGNEDAERMKASPASAAESESDDALERENGGDEFEEVGRLVDGLLGESHVVLYYKVLFERHEEFFRRLGIECSQDVRAAIKKSRPNADVRTFFVASENDRGVEALELTRREIERRWGDNPSTTVKKLAEALYAPKNEIQKTLTTYSSQFKRVERDAFLLTSSRDDENLSRPSKKDGDKKRVDRSRAGIQDENDAKKSAQLSFFSDATPELESPSGDESDADRTSTASHPTLFDWFQEPESSPVATPKPEKSRVQTATPAPPKQTPLERLREIVEELALSGQLILYYHTLLERNEELGGEYVDKTALRAALEELFPSFRYADSYFEPRRRSAKETEEAKIRRSLILCWGDAQQQRLDALAQRFCAPQKLIERTLKNSPDDFSDRGRQRFALKDKAREEAARLREHSAKLLDDLKSTLASDGSYLFYESYFDANAEWLAEMGIDSVPLLRRELANLNKDAALGYVFYRNHCERQGGALSESDFIRRLIQTRFGGETRLRVGLLAEELRIPATLIRDALGASGDFIFEGGDCYRRR